MRRADGRVVVFIDEIHTLVGAGSTGEGPQDAANELKTAMARGEFPCIGATTHDEFRKFIAAGPGAGAALHAGGGERAVGAGDGGDPAGRASAATRSTTGCATAGGAGGGRVAGGALRDDRFMPDKAISVVDLAGSRCRREGKTAVEPRTWRAWWRSSPGCPEERLLMNDSARLLRLEEDLARARDRPRGGRRPDRAGHPPQLRGLRQPPADGRFLFLGPTGVGKTEMARALADVLFGSRDALVRLDMSEMSESHGVSRLIGAPAGLRGLSARAASSPSRCAGGPSSVVVLDEIEKAHREVLMLLLQVLEEGRLTDGKGRHIDFSNTVIVLTTNLGAEAFRRTGRAVGFGAADAAARAARGWTLGGSRAHGAAPGAVEPHRRAAAVPAARPRRRCARIATLLLAESSRRLADGAGHRLRGRRRTWWRHLLESGGFDPLLGARPMRQMVQRLVEAPLAERILAGKLAAGSRVRVRVVNGRIRFGGDTLG